MTRTCLISLLAAATGCAFSTPPLSPSSPDAGSDAPDARPPAVPDAAELPDGGACPARARELALGVATLGTAAGQSQYEATCAPRPTGPEQLYQLDVAAAANVDLVIDVIDGQPEIDSVVELTTDCRGADAVCANRGRAGGGEVLVAEGIAPGTYFVALDTADGSGSFGVTAFLRGVVASGAECSRDLTASRCERDHECIDLDDDGTAVCESMDAVPDAENNETPCAASTVLASDGVFAGKLAGALDVDVVAVEPPADRELHALIHDGAGGCPADLVLELLTGDTCEAATLTSSDDDGGLGPCPLLRATVPGGQRSWLRIAASPGAPPAASASYVLVVDL